MIETHHAPPPLEAPAPPAAEHAAALRLAFDAAFRDALQACGSADRTRALAEEAQKAADRTRALAEEAQAEAGRLIDQWDTCRAGKLPSQQIEAAWRAAMRQQVTANRIAENATTAQISADRARELYEQVERAAERARRLAVDLSARAQVAADLAHGSLRHARAAAAFDNTPPSPSHATTEPRP